MQTHTHLSDILKVLDTIEVFKKKNTIVVQFFCGNLSEKKKKEKLARNNLSLSLSFFIFELLFMTAEHT